MKRRFLPFSLLLVIMILGQYVMADQGGHYVPRVKGTNSAEAYLSSMRVNQQTGMIDPAWMLKASKAVNNTRDDNSLYWLSMGPDNLGGRTTSIVYNRNNMNEVFIGSMGGGVFYTWNLGVSWHQVGENLMVSCMAQAEDGTIYVGTGDGGEAVNYNPLNEVSYENSFIGSGLYAIKKNGNNYEMSAVASTTPTEYNGVTEWSFINDVAVVENTVVVATESGVKYSSTTDGLVNWNYAKTLDADNNPVDLTGNALEVKVASDKTVIASVDGMIYVGSLNNMVCRSNATEEVVNENGEIEMIFKADGLLDIAVAPSDPKVIYAASVNSSGNHYRIYISEDQGQTWRIALPQVTNSAGHQVYGGRGLFNHGLAVDPSNPHLVYVLGYDLWSLQMSNSDPNGYFLCIKQSDGNNNSIYSASYLHVGLNAMQFDPRNPRYSYIATDGGIFKAESNSNSNYLTYTNSNRGYVTTRALSVAHSGDATRVITGLLDHGPVLVEANEDYDNIHMSHGTPLYPTNNAGSFGVFSEDYHGGRAAISTINPNMMFVGTKDGAMRRSETNFVDYDIANFTQSFSYTGYSMPFVLWECFDDENNSETVWYFANENLAAGQMAQCYSNNAEYPFKHKLEHAMLDGDSIEVHDPIMAKLFVASNNTLQMTTQALRFDVSPTFYTIAKKATGFSGTPMCLSVSADGDVLFSGMRNGALVRVANLRAAVDANTAHPDSANFAPVITPIELPISGQCVTSVSIYAQDANKVVVTLGNYGNDQYVLFSENALSDEPTFTVKQGNLPKMPVYSSVYEMSTGKVILGTERGIYMTDNIAASNVNWVPAGDNMGVVPVLDMQQQTKYQPDQIVITPIFSEEGVTYDTTYYVGVHNQGAIYAATYGRGVFRCENFLQHIGTGVDDNTSVAVKSLNMYPNPVHTEACVSFALNSKSNVSYQVFDMTGRMVKVMELGTLTEGNHEVKVSVEGLSDGAYLLRLNAGTNVTTVKFMVF